jgi:hypothetical protein
MEAEADRISATKSRVLTGGPEVAQGVNYFRRADAAAESGQQLISDFCGAGYLRGDSKFGKDLVAAFRSPDVSKIKKPTWLGRALERPA